MSDDWRVGGQSTHLGEGSTFWRREGAASGWVRDMHVGQTGSLRGGWPIANRLPIGRQLAKLPHDSTA